MFIRRAMLLAVIAILAVVPPAISGHAATTPKCTDIPIWITIVPIDGGVLAGDSKGSVYKAGVDGVNFAMINICGTSPTYDATMGLSISQRTMAFTFPPAIAGSIINGPSPVWANGVQFPAKPILYVRNILWGRMNGLYTFTTRMIVKSITGPGDSATYDLRFQPATVDALDNPPPYPDINLPSETATITVQDTPGTCRSIPGGTLDSWMVTVDTPFVGTLYRIGGRNQGYIHSGQYVMPFKLLVQAQSCVPSSLTK
jgi:hypothetical protein